MQIAFNNNHFTEFNHRISFTNIINLAIDGQVSISLIAFEGTGGQLGFQAPSAPIHPSVPYPGAVPYPPGGGILPPQPGHYPGVHGVHPPHQGGYPGVGGSHLGHQGAYPGGHASPYPVQPGLPHNYAGLSPHAAVSCFKIYNFQDFGF